MKKGLLFLAVAAMAFTSCDKVPVIENFGISNVFEESVLLEISDTDPSVFAKDFVIDPSAAADFKDNLDQISSYSVKKLSYKITSFSGDVATQATIVAQFSEGADKIGDPISLGDVSFQKLLDSGDEVEIPVNDDLKVTLQDMLLNDRTITLTVGGAVTHKPMKSDIVLMVELEALVKVE